MIYNILIEIFVLALGSISLFAGDFTGANKRFQEGDFTGAASAYEEILKSDGSNASVFYNLGNSYFRLGKLGPAILAYERARILTPRDPLLLSNLARARKDAAVTGDTQLAPWVNAIANKLSPNEWSCLLVGTALALGVLSIVASITRLPRRWTRGAVGFSLCCIAISAAALYLRRSEASRGVIVADNAAIRLSPFESAESIRTLPQGQIIQIGASQSEFHHIEAPGLELRGWLADRDFSAIIPGKP